MSRALDDALEGGAAVLFALALGHKPPHRTAACRLWSAPLPLLATFRSPSAARTAARLLSAYDPGARVTSRSAVVACVPFAVAAAAVVAVGLPELLALGAAPPRLPRDRGGRVRVAR